MPSSAPPATTSGDACLTLPGGYRPGWQAEYRIGIEVAWSRYTAEYEFRGNGGGSGEPIGLFALTIRQ